MLTRPQRYLIRPESLQPAAWLAQLDKALAAGARRVQLRARGLTAQALANLAMDARTRCHAAGAEFSPHARKPVAGSGDFCLITETPIAQVQAHLWACGVAIEQGPVPRTGATGKLLSVYFRDPDGNLVEVSNRL